MADLAVLQQTLGVTFNDVSRLEQAMVHTSYLNENPGFSMASNERLEFLGDAVLGLIVTEKLYQDFPGSDEGEMTRLRATLVRRETLAGIARTIKVGDYFYMGKGEEANGGRNKPANLASGLEALIAAVYLDGGLTVARECTLKILDAEFHKVARQGAGVDYKSELQEFLQARKQPTPVYHVIEATGPDHDRAFSIEVKSDETVLGRGSGKSKKAAESEAARVALERLRAN
ncbi:MAG: ribonuclease III [Chloroflexi bacterium]|nr:ribonuclease III [Chloroflexota bacterium]